MKNFVLFFLLSFFIEGVFGDSVSVKEGDSVALHTGLTEIQDDDVLEWRFGAGLVRIARVSKDSKPTIFDDVLGGRFRGRLKPDGQTGDLTITNITTEHAGPYEISIDAIASRTFNVIVVSAGPVKTVSLMVGDSVTLHTGVPEPHRYGVIQWMFKKSLIAEINRKIGKSITSNTERLKLDYLTGSLTIRNTETKHSGDYEVDIISSNHTIHKSFTVTVSGAVKSVSVMEGESVTLNSDLTEIQTDDFMQWVFRDSQIAGIHKADNFTFDDRLKLDHQTGSLTITHSTTTDSGLYELKISSSRRTIHRRITVTVTGGLSPGAIAGIVIGVLLLVCGAAAAAVIYHRRKISELKEWVYKWGIQSVMVGERITLTPDEEHKDNKLLWIFRGSCIAARESAAHSFTVYDHLPDGRFEGRLELDDHTGSLTIPMTRTTDTGVYELMIIRPGDISIKRFSVSVFAQTDMKPVSVKEGGPVTLKTDVTDIQKDGQIQWKLGYTLLAKVKRGTKKVSPSANKIFQDRLELDHHTGSLTIKRIRPTDAGIYMLYKIEGGNLKTDLFKVEVLENKPEEESVRKNNPENVPLRSVHADSRL